jgi:hypothetical protein
MTDTSKEAAEHLRMNQGQMDMDGTFVQVSRQALDQVLDAYDALQKQAAQPEMVAEVKPLVWEQIDEWTEGCHDMHGNAYTIWSIDGFGYCKFPQTLAGERFAGGLEVARAEAQAYHNTTVRASITTTPKAAAIREGMERALELVTGFPEVKLRATIPCDPSEAITETCREVAAAIRKAMEDV